MDGFKEKVLKVVRKIPKGKMMSYKEVAKKTGKPKAYRAVGNILSRCDGWEKGIPCHRVILSDGRVGGYAKGTKRKQELLKGEGGSP